MTHARVGYRMLCREQMRRVLKRLFSIVEHYAGSAEEKLGMGLSLRKTMA
jgi:hypothetical protein